MTDELPKPNLPLLRKVLDHIDHHPEEWQQSSWVGPKYEYSTDPVTGVGQYREVPMCGTAYCVAGHALVMTGHTLELIDGDIYLDDEEDHDYRIPGTNDWTSNVEQAASKELGLTNPEADMLFSGSNSRETVQRVAEKIAKRAGEKL